MSDEFLLVKDLGEQNLLERLKCFCPPDVVGDDGAVLTTAPDKSLVVTTDVLVDGVHFSDRTTSPYDVGWRAVAANLSDLAAMGATPLGITVGLSLPGQKSVKWVEMLYQGMVACLDNHQTPIVGGDICRSQVTTISITALGQVAPTRIISRSNARPGDAIIITGSHGLSRGGLEILLSPHKGENLAAKEREKLIQAHQRPQPRLDVLEYLDQIPESVAIAGMDSSDGLADAISQICHCSNVGALIYRESLSLFPGLIQLAGLEISWEWLLYGGEDFELVLCIAEKYATKLLKNLGTEGKIIGKVTANKEIKIIDSSNLYPSQTLKINKGFQHF